MFDRTRITNWLIIAAAASNSNSSERSRRYRRNEIDILKHAVANKYRY